MNRGLLRKGVGALRIGLFCVGRGKRAYCGRQTTAVIFGANRGIGFGFVRKLAQDSMYSQIYATYRNRSESKELLELARVHPSVIKCLQLDVLNEKHIEQAASRIKRESGKLHLSLNCVGILHDDNLSPEKSLKQISPEKLLRYFETNSIPSVIIAKHFLPLFCHKERSILAAISAKVGSIGDNALGGWYGYRASKSALNMLMRTVALEYRRPAPNAIVVLLHPGTTATNLSLPFQKGVPEGSLFSIDKTVGLLLSVIKNLQPSDTGHFFSWNGTKLPW